MPEHSGAPAVSSLPIVITHHRDRRRTQEVRLAWRSSVLVCQRLAVRVGERAADDDSSTQQREKVRRHGRKPNLLHGAIFLSHYVRPV